ncbi:hypothetical protein PAHAL_4G078900 [Panicum hallii]|uniref:Bifunctional inhibitor/plant lipid transfer protein/seed storage helical domain-containing protein n=1 Tax=Panicum hallii TaxID=206008 RepID=A0A2T8JC75_9POAL|nr:hypothetical protein PAHAL_4G078900 [Panicum hallii]
MASSPGRAVFFLVLALVLLGDLRCCSCSQVRTTALLDCLNDSQLFCACLHELPLLLRCSNGVTLSKWMSTSGVCGLHGQEVAGRQ